MRFNKYKILIYSAITVTSIAFAYSANYAMVYRITAAILSRLAVVYCVGILAYVLFSDKGWSAKNRCIVMAWAGPLLYSMNKFAVIVIIIYYILGERIYNFMNDEGGAGENLPPFKLERLLKIAGDIFSLSLAFLLVDITREYTVWKHLVLHPLPLISTVAAALLLLSNYLFKFRRFQ